MQLDAVRSLRLSSLLVGLAALLSACGSDAECVIDSDCPSLAHRCEANACVPLGAPPPVDLGRVDMGAPDAATDGGLLDAGPSMRLSGNFTAESAPGTYTVSASFTETPPTPPGPCTKHEEGPCIITVCTAEASTAIARSAGSLMVSGGSSTVTLTPNADETYTPMTAAEALFGPGTALTFEGTGNADGGVPAFSGMVTSPSMATLTTPALVSDTPIVISRVDDFAVAWSAGGPVGTIDVRFSAAGMDGGSTSARCRFPIADFSGTIPSAAFTDFPAGVMGRYSFAIQADTSVTPGGDWNVTLVARNPLATASGAPSSGDAVF